MENTPKLTFDEAAQAYEKGTRLGMQVYGLDEVPNAIAKHAPQIINTLMQQGYAQVDTFNIGRYDDPEASAMGTNKFSFYVENRSGHPLTPELEKIEFNLECQVENVPCTREWDPSALRQS